ncbi:MAG: long-chain fatty acid--CoA ligase, partial [Desulfobacterales bacterium]|nr:long-chain fatty acid--CoA ligase [Desulfobacterales bacterium]
VISAHPAIAMMALIGIDNPEKPGSEFVKACIQRNPDHDFDGDEKALKRDILAFAREKCAPYEVPKIIQFLDEIPLTPIGKVDKKSLRGGG